MLVRHAQATSANLDVDLHRALLGAELASGLADGSRPAASAAGNSLSGACLCPTSWAFILFRREDTEINPTSLANRKLVTRGPYQFTRNPMYLGLVTLSLGIAVWIGAWPMFMAPLATFATVNWVHIPFEEAKMRRQFGAAYDDYVAQVRRWV
jgi:protein-S-isoprenylcysteine O-methyltransferase Ste14